MKRSEFMLLAYEEVRKEYQTASIIETLVDARRRGAEAAGVVWDPEEEPLPQKLTCNAICDGRGVLRPHLFPAESLPWEWIREEHKTEELAIYAEAVRRYNAWPELEKKANEYGAWGCRFDELRAILRGGSR